MIVIVCFFTLLFLFLCSHMFSVYVSCNGNCMYVCVFVSICLPESACICVCACVCVCVCVCASLRV